MPSFIIQESDQRELVRSPLWELNNWAAIIPPQVYTSLAADAIGWGWLNFLVDSSENNLDGNTYLTLTATNNMVLTGGGFGTLAHITGTLVLDPYNGSVVSHVMDQPPPGTVLTVGGGAYAPWPPTSSTGTDAQWTSVDGLDQEIVLSNPQTVDDLITICGSLLDAGNILSLKSGDGYITGYADAHFFSTDKIYWVPTWVNDPGTGNVIAAWVNVGSGGIVLDRDIPAYVAPQIYLNDVGTFGDPGPPGPPNGIKTRIQFTQGTFGTSAGASRLVVRQLPNNSKHCASDIPDANAITAGNTQSAFEVDADATGVLLLFEPGISITSTLQEEEVDRYLYLNYHPSGITCAP